MNIIISNDAQIPNKFIRYIKWRVHRLKEKFGTIDSNGDGFVTKTELENARPQRGQGRPPRG